jgi:hypothetical protein
MMNNLRTLRTDQTWNGGCETVTRTGKRKGKLCNNRNYCKKTMPDGSKLKSCYMHSDGDHQDVENETSFYNDGIDDEIYSNDFEFIAPEDDGTVLVNGKVFVKEAENFPQESENSIPYQDETESEYDPQEDESSQTSTVVSYADETESEAETETEAEQSIPNENRDDASLSTEKCDRFFYYKFLEEKEKSDRLEAKIQEYKFSLEAEKQKMEDYKREIFATVVDDSLSEEKLVDEINSIKEKFESSEKEKEKIVDDINTEKEKVKSLEQFISDQRVEHTDHMTRSLQFQGSQMKKQIEALENEIETYKNKEKNVKSLEKLLNDKNQTIYDLSCEIENYEKDNNIEKAKVIELEKLLQEEKLLQKLGEQINKDKLNAEVESLEKLLSYERSKSKELKSRLYEIFNTTNGFQTNMRNIMITSGFYINEDFVLNAC